MLMANQVILYIVRCCLFMDYRKIDAVWELLGGVLGIPKCDADETYNWTRPKWHPYNEKTWKFDQALNIELVQNKLVTLGINRKHYVFGVVCSHWIFDLSRMNGVELSFKQADAIDYYLEMLTLAPLPPEITHNPPQTVTSVHKSELDNILNQVRFILRHRFGIINLVFKVNPEEMGETIETINSQLGLVKDGVAATLVRHSILLLELVGEMLDEDACEYIDLTSKITSCCRKLYNYRPAKFSTGQSLMWHALDRIAVVIERKLCN